MDVMATQINFRASSDLWRRRDSHSSSTRDSGYDSDLEVSSSSPLEFVSSDQDLHYAPLPVGSTLSPVSEVPHLNKSLLCARYSDLIKPSSRHNPNITSYPVSSPSVGHWNSSENKTVNTTRANHDPFSSTEESKKTEPASQDEDIERWIKENLPPRKRPRERLFSITSLSSTSSCEMYTTTDDISDEEQEYGSLIQQSIYPISTLKVIKLILRKIEVNLRNAAYRQCTGGNESSRTSSRSTLGSQESGRKASQRTGHKRKPEGSPPPDDEDGENEGSNKRRRGSATVTDGSDTGARFACPFYKHDPDWYRSRRTCPGPGWPTVHRMKEHLYRSHAQPIFCPICYSTFKSDKEQSNHIRLQQCQRSGPQQIEGIDRETITFLRKRTTALRLEEDKWRDVYHILFPEVPTPDIPSPFYDCDSPSEASRRFRCDLLRRVQEELLTTAGQTSGSVEQQLLRQVAYIIRRCERELLQSQEPPPSSSSSSSVNAFASERRTSYSSTTSAESLSPRTHHLNSSHNTAAASHEFSSPPLPQQESCSNSSSSSLQVPRYGPSVVNNNNNNTTEPVVDFGPVDWGSGTYNPFGEFLDWYDVFPTGAPNVSVDGEGESFTAISAPMYT